MVIQKTMARLRNSSHLFEGCLSRGLNASGTARKLHAQQDRLRKKDWGAAPDYHFQSGISGSSPQMADPALLAVADPVRFAVEKGDATPALSVDR